MHNELFSILQANQCRLRTVVTEFADTVPLNVYYEDFHGDKKIDVTIETCDNQMSVSMNADIKEEYIALSVTFKVIKGIYKSSGVGVAFNFDHWSKENYVLMPAAVYNGNRFKSLKMEYPPMLQNHDDIGLDIPITITDVPRLNIDEGTSRIQLITRDMATPAIGFYSPGNCQGFLLVTEQNTVLGDSGIEIEESSDRKTCKISIAAPGIRHKYRYAMGDISFPCDDKSVDINEGESITINMKVYFFVCSSIQMLFDKFAEVRKVFSHSNKGNHILPFSSSWDILEKKYMSNWVESQGYYSVGTGDSIFDKWQIGWVGGMMCTYPLMLEGSDLSRKRALQNFDFIFPYGQGNAGFFYGIGDGDNWYGDNFKDMENKSWHLIRKSSDALYYIIKQLVYMKENNIKVSDHWETGTKKCADAFVNLWTRYGQFGQFVNADSGEIIIGGSTSGAVAPAGLALAFEYFGDEKYIETAKEAANAYYNLDVTGGVTTGGPGEICQCPDSESAFGLLESFVVLYEVTKEHHWLKKAEDMAKQCMTWCVSYNFVFPEGSTFRKLGMQTLGTVYANVQNKHSAPGICTHSGVALFKLYRYTGNTIYLELCKEIAHSLPQYLSREDRPIKSWNDDMMLPSGWMCERVNMCDWEGKDKIGEVFFGSCWSEVSLMLTYAEIPGLYVQPDTGFICAIDHIEAKVIENTDQYINVRLHNTTGFQASVKPFVESSNRMGQVLGQNFLWKTRRIDLSAGEQTMVKFFKNTN